MWVVWEQWLLWRPPLQATESIPCLGAPGLLQGVEPRAVQSSWLPAHLFCCQSLVSIDPFSIRAEISGTNQTQSLCGLKGFNYSFL